LTDLWSALRVGNARDGAKANALVDTDVGGGAEASAVRV
jgi:hypothetical protein